jgi:hypothetical protein
MQISPLDSPSSFLRRFIRAGWILLALNSIWTLIWTLILTWQFSFDPPPRLREEFIHSGLTPGVYFGVNALVIIAIFGCFFTIALILFLRLPNDRLAFFTAIFLLGFGTANAYPLAPEFLDLVYSADRLYILIPTLINNLLSWPLLIFFFALYPDGIFVPVWMRFVAGYGFFFSLGWGILPQIFAAPQGGLAVFIFLSVLFVFGSSFYAQIYRYRTYSSPFQRQQTKWMVYGFAVVTVSTTLQQIVAGAVAFAENDLSAQSIFIELFYSLVSLTYVMIPISIGVAILRYRLWDIDLIIRRTLVYGVLTGLLALIYFGGVVLFQTGFRTLTRETNSTFVTVISTLAIAALFTPLRHRVQDFIDRRFYRKKYNAEQALAQFAATARDEVDMDKLAAALLGVVEETMQPEKASLWLKPTADRSGQRQTVVSGQSSAIIETSRGV